MCRNPSITIIFLAFAAACGSAPPAAAPSFPDEALVEVAGSAGQLSVEVRSSPQPPVRGRAIFQLKVTGLHGGVEGLNIAVQPWMPLMGHGTSVKPVVKEMGNGVYEVSDVYLFMAGLWELRTEFEGEAVDHVAPQFEIH